MGSVADADDALRRIDALVQIAVRLANQAPSGRIALAKLVKVVDPAWVPPPWNRTLWPGVVASSHDAAAEPLPFKAVESVLRDAWGVKPTAELDSLDSEPVAVTPVAQVHRGVLDGGAVAVKVLRPGLTGSVRQDLALLDALAAPLGGAFPGIDPAAVVREARERVLDALDLEHVAGMQRRLSRAVRGLDFVVVPAPVTRLAAPEVLVSEWIDGTPLSAADGFDHDLIAGRLLRYVAGGLRAGLVDADLDADDVLVLNDGRLAIVGPGSLTNVDAERATLTAQVIEAFAAADGPALGSALSALKLLDSGHGELALSVAQHVLGSLGGEAASTLDTPALLAAAERAAERDRDLVALLLAGSFEPVDLWPGRALGQAFGLITRFGATAPWRSILLESLRDGWG